MDKGEPESQDDSNISGRSNIINSGTKYWFSVSIIKGVPKKCPLRIFRKDWTKFSITVLKSRIICIYTSFKKRINIISHKAKKSRPAHFCKTAWLKKDLALKRFFFYHFYKTATVFFSKISSEFFLFKVMDLSLLH